MGNTKHLEKPTTVINTVACEDCGDVCSRKVTYRKVQYPQPHWKISCNCEKIQHPETGEFLHKNTTVMREYYSSNNVKKTKRLRELAK
jgi:hypothetical protein